MTTTSVGKVDRLLEAGIDNRIRTTSKAGIRVWTAVAAVFIALAAGLPVAAQDTRGSISGLVVDASGAVVQGAKITVTEAATSVVADTTSQADGLFLVAG